jgi:hypothetical protein
MFELSKNDLSFENQFDHNDFHFIPTLRRLDYQMG